MIYPAASCPQPWTFEMKHAMYPRNTVIGETRYKHFPSKGDKQKGGKECPGQLSNTARQAASNLNSFEKLWLVSFCLPGSRGRGLAFWSHQGGNSAPEGWLCRFRLSELWKALPPQLCNVSPLSWLDSCAYKETYAGGYNRFDSNPISVPRWGLS